MTIHPQTVTETIADGLDALTDGRGFNAEHMRATLLANAAPDLLAALEFIVLSYGDLESGAMDLARAAIEKATMQ